MYRSGSFPTLHLQIDPSREFREVVDEISSVGLPPLRVNTELAAFAVLELVSNSVRAHRERGIGEAVSVSYSTDEEGLSITVLDAGRGFDPRLLPYDLDGSLDSVDLMGSSFASYREAHGGSRFGMGLYVARKTFPRFRLLFVDREGRECPWFAGSVRGTRIELGVPFADCVEELAEIEEIEELEGGIARSPAGQGDSDGRR